MSEENKEKHIKKFTDYYSDPEWKKRFLDRMKEKQLCQTCGRNVARNNLSRHQKSNICAKFSQSNSHRIKVLEAEIQRISNSQCID